MALAGFAIAVGLVCAGVLSTAAVALCTLRRSEGRISKKSLGGAAAAFSLTLLGVYWITSGLTQSIDAAVQILDTGPVVADTLAGLDCAVDPALVRRSRGFAYNFDEAAAAAEESVVLSLWWFFGPLVASVAATAVLFDRCACCCATPGSVVAPIALAAAGGVVISAGSRAVCTAYLDAGQLPADVRYLVDRDAPDTEDRVLSAADYAQLADTCAAPALEAAARFTRPGAFSDEYETVYEGVCTHAFAGGLLVTVLAWAVLGGLIACARPRGDDGNK